MIEVYDKRSHPTPDILNTKWKLVKELTLEEVKAQTNNAFSFGIFELGRIVMYSGRTFFGSAPEIIRKGETMFQVWHKQ